MPTSKMSSIRAVVSSIGSSRRVASQGADLVVVEHDLGEARGLHAVEAAGGDQRVGAGEGRHSAVMPPSEPAWKSAALASAEMPVACVSRP